VTHRAVYSLFAFGLREQVQLRRGDGSCARMTDPCMHAPTFAPVQGRQMIIASSPIMPIPITSTASATGS
jgi:hypothetical protein